VNVLSAAEKERRIGQLEEEIGGIWISLLIGCIMFLALQWGIEPMMRTVLDRGSFPTTLVDIIFNYIIGAAFWIGYIIGIITILKKKKEIRRYKKEKNSPSKINMQKDDINQYEKGDRDMMKRVFNQNNKVSTNKMRSKGSPIRSYNGSTRSSNSTESNNIALDVALESSIYSTGNDNDCSSSSSSNYHSSGSDYSSSSSSYHSSSSDYSSSSSGYDGGSSCD